MLLVCVVAVAVAVAMGVERNCVGGSAYNIIIPLQKYIKLDANWMSFLMVVCS